ncbi:MAG: type VI secretion system baseplate subunit TssG [Planctomycetes bacterium]|nr:type VI secretion system baseplate subunit TssG [Planctomycetota bacterium]MBL7038375.1 type VI secretion system baseplate subunit TssG [Pirellulaceae bacterium]
MAATSGRKGASVTERLAAEPHKFDFFQAVRLLEHIARERSKGDPDKARVPVGDDGPPRHETVRFRAFPSHTFPSSEITSLTFSEEDPSDEAKPSLADMVVTFLGLTGPSGVLPQHYTQLVIDRIRQKDDSLRDFLDLFNHRTVSLFFRAWEKYRLPAAFERSAVDPSAGAEDPFTRCLYSLVGLGTDRVRSRLAVTDPAFLYFSGHFSHHPRTVTGLECIIADYFELPVDVLQFQGQWLYLSLDDQSCTPSAIEPDGRNCQLGFNVVVGERVWSVENKFRVRLGPVGYEQFCRFTPMGEGLMPLCQLVRSYVGPEFDFDIQPVLRAQEAPECKIGGDIMAGSRLGWNTWLRSKPLPKDADEAVFVNEGYP